MKSRLFVLANGDKGLYWIEKPDGKVGQGEMPVLPVPSLRGPGLHLLLLPAVPVRGPGAGRVDLSSKGYPVWTCKDCRLLHHKKAAGYLKKHPDAGIDELKRLAPG